MAKVINRCVVEYLDASGKSPFKQWIKHLKDSQAQAKIITALSRMASGNFGDHKSIKNGNGLQEHRLFYGPGYRIYYLLDGNELVILFGGSNKSGQLAAIKQAKQHLARYLREKKHASKP